MCVYIAIDGGTERSAQRNQWPSVRDFKYEETSKRVGKLPILHRYPVVHSIIRLASNWMQRIAISASYYQIRYELFTTDPRIDWYH